MSAKIKLQRIGSKNQPSYRVVVQDSTDPTRGRVVEILGQYNTLVEPSRFEVDKEKTLDWIRKGAKPTEKVRILLGKAGILPPIDLASLPKRKPKGAAEEEKPAAEEKPAEEAKPEEAKPEEPKAEEAKAAEAKPEEVKAEEIPAAAEPPAAKAEGGAEK